MKKGIYLATLGFLPAGLLSAQGLLNNGAFIVTSGAAQIYIAGGTNGDYTSQANGRITPSAGAIFTLEGDWINNAGNTGFTADAGTVVLNGAAEGINGSSSTTFYNLTLQGTNTKTLNVNASVGGAAVRTGVLSLGTRPLDLNSRFLTITNTAVTAVTYTTGYVLSETNVSVNPSVMAWSTGAFSATYVYPFGTVAGTQIPLTFNKTVATASIVNISTRPTAGSNNTPWAGTVTHMYDPTLAQDGSDEAVIDRWWEINASATVTADITFRYLGSENTLQVPYNTGNLGAQYWSAAWLPNNATIGSAPAVLAGVGAVTASGLNIPNAYMPWVLSSVTAPLPVELLGFNANCSGHNAVLHWATATEINNHYFEVERSENGQNWASAGTVNTQAAGGNSTTTLNYSFVDPNPLTMTTYYRLHQVDINGSSTNSSSTSVQPCGESNEYLDAFNGSDNQLNVQLNSSFGGTYTVQVYDDRGRQLFHKQVQAEEGFNQFMLSVPYPATGIYLINVQGATQQMAKRIFITQ